MLGTLGWMLLGGLPQTPTATYQEPPLAAHVTMVPRVAVWADRDDPYARGDGADVFLNVAVPSHVAVLRVDTDGRLRVLFPRQPWTDTYVEEERELQVSGPRGGRAFLVDDDPGVGYLLAIASSEPLDFRSITRGDSWDYRLIDGGRIQGDPYVRLTDLVATLAPAGHYDYDISPYYVGQRYDYPRFVCYGCHANASNHEWDPYGSSCSRYRVVIRDDAEYYPYRYGGRTVVAEHAAHPAPRFVFRAAEPRRSAVRRAEPVRPRSGDDDPDRSNEAAGATGAVPAPRIQSMRGRSGESSGEPSPARPAMDPQRRPDPPSGESTPPRSQDGGNSGRDVPEGLRATNPPRSTGEPELRRRRP
jgi:Domain of unknown function (DUF4384)